MFIKYILNKLDVFLCKYVGLEEKYVRPAYFELTKTGATISTISFCQRHLTKTSWQDFIAHDIKYISQNDLEKLGKTMGAGIANNLIISFSEVHIDNNYSSPANN